MALDKNTFKKAYENKYKDIHGDEIENGNNPPFPSPWSSSNSSKSLKSIFNSAKASLHMSIKLEKSKFIISLWNFF